MAEPKNDALAVPQDVAGMLTTQRPEGADEGMLGNEHIGRDDVLTPRIAVAQKTSPELDPTSPRYIEGLKFTDLFNSITKKIYGKGPVYFAILRADKPRGVEFRPLEEGGGVIDPNVPLDDQRMQFGPVDQATGRSEKPKATKFYDFVVLVLNDLDPNDPMSNVVGLSFKSTGLKVAKHLNLLINQRGKKLIYKGAYELRSDSDTKNGNTFAVYKIKNAGWLQPDSAIEKLAAEMFEAWKDRTVNIDLGTAHVDEDDSFDTASMEREGQPQM